MDDGVLVGPGGCRADDHLDVRGLVGAILYEDMCDTKDRCCLSERPLSIRGTLHQGYTYACTRECQYTYQDESLLHIRDQRRKLQPAEEHGLPARGWRHSGTGQAHPHN